jgi:hypothetical protein
MEVPTEGVRVKGGSLASAEVMLFFLRLERRTFFIFFLTVSRDLLESSESELEDELESELDESSQLATGPGVASASTIC